MRFQLCTMFRWLRLVAGAGLLSEKITAGWLVAGDWCWFGVRENTDRVMAFLLYFCGSSCVSSDKQYWSASTDKQT